MQFDLGAQNRQQAFVFPGLLNEVARAAAHGFDGQPNIAPGGHYDDRNAAVEGNDFGEQVETFLAGGGVAGVVQVDQYGVVELAGQGFAHGSRRLGGVNIKALGTQQQLDGFKNVRLVVGRQNAAGTGLSRVSEGASRNVS